MLKFYKKITSIFILIITIYILIDFNLKLPTGIIKRRYLIVTPIKTSMSDVEKYLKNNNYEIWNINNFGYRNYPSDKKQGFYHIKIVIGEYRWLFTRSVIGIWIFDENKQLIEIIVRKEINVI